MRVEPQVIRHWVSHHMTHPTINNFIQALNIKVGIAKTRFRQNYELNANVAKAIF